MNKNYITSLYDSGNISKVDTHFANFITDISKDNNPEIFLGAALVSSATGNGDICLDLGSVSEKQMMEEKNGDTPVIFPKLDVWLEKLRKSPVVGNPGEFCPLILDENNRLYLYRYWEYEKKLSSAISSVVLRASAIPKDCFWTVYLMFTPRLLPFFRYFLICSPL